MNTDISYIGMMNKFNQMFPCAAQDFRPAGTPYEMYVWLKDGSVRIVRYSPLLDCFFFVAEEVTKTNVLMPASWQWHISFEKPSRRNDFDVCCSFCGAIISCEDLAEAKSIFGSDECPACGHRMKAGVIEDALD